MRSGGAERVLSIIANYLVNDGWSVTIITISKSEVYYDIDSRVYLKSLGMDQKSKNIFEAIKFNYQRGRELTKLFKEINPNIVVSFTTTVNVTSIVSARFASIPIIMSERSNPWKIAVPSYWRVFSRFVFPLSQYIVVQTERTKDFYRRHGVPIKKIYNPLVVEEGYSSLSQKNRKKVILAVGRLNHIKRFDLLIESFKKVKNRDDWKLVILGDGEDREKLESLIVSLEMSHEVLLEGKVKNVDEYMKKSSIFILTSKHEGFPNALCESMMYGMAPISFDCETGPSEIIDSGVNGLLIKNGDRSKLIESIENLISDIELREKFSKNALKITEKLDQDNIIEEWQSLIGEVIEKYGD
jgi:GalNAc-alpha-(1->4)-GalNAc-alpha-(1->3)-diNAcBac-PP-undecaprenol alpha-1,4-N-acetyl-D-galactosaminyltransferase